MVGLTSTALAPRRRHTSRSVIIVGWRGLGGASQLPQPHLKDGSVYRPLRPTVMDSNFHESNEAHPDNCPIWLPLLNSTHHPEYRRL